MFLSMHWSRGIAAHSLVRRVSLCSADEAILKNHKLVPELAG
jgi:hypothetical protein